MLQNPNIRTESEFLAPLLLSLFHSSWVQSHRLQLSRNVRDSPGFVAIVPGTGRPLYGSIVGPGVVGCRDPPPHGPLVHPH